MDIITRHSRLFAPIPDIIDAADGVNAIARISERFTNPVICRPVKDISG